MDSENHRTQEQYERAASASSRLPLRTRAGSSDHPNETRNAANKHPAENRLESAAKCSGLNYSLQLHNGSIEVRPRFQDKKRNLPIDQIGSVELLRKSVMPPALVGLLATVAYSALALPGGWLAGILPFGMASPLQSVSLGVAVVCLVMLVVRWFFTNLVLKPSNTSPIILRMVPANGARRFVAFFQTQVRLPHET